MSSFESIYNLFIIEFEIFKDYLDEFLIKKFIVSFFSSTKISILFAKKSENDLKFCVNYKKLNVITIKNQYSISLMNQLLNRFNDVKKFIKLNIQTTYNFIRIKKKNEWKTIFRCRYEQFEYRIMSFDLANAFATFQIHINFALKEYLNDFCVCYLNYILIYFQREKNHTNHVRLVLKRLKRHKMFVKLSKCVFDLEEIDYLKFIVEINDICMNLAKIVTIKKWVESTTRRHVRIFIKFAKSYKRFIKKFNKIAKSLTNLFKERKKKEFDKTFKFIKKTRKTFKKLKEVFIKTSILLHFAQNSNKNRHFRFRHIRNYISIDQRNRSMTFHCILFSKNVRSEAKLWNWRRENARDDRIMSCFSTLRERSVVFDSNVDRSR
jgi:hypothetical protein